VVEHTTRLLTACSFAQVHSRSLSEIDQQVGLGQSRFPGSSNLAGDRRECGTCNYGNERVSNLSGITTAASKPNSDDDQSLSKWCHTCHHDINENDSQHRDEALLVIRKYAEVRQIPLGQAASDSNLQRAREPSSIQDQERVGDFRTSSRNTANHR